MVNEIRNWKLNQFIPLKILLLDCLRATKLFQPFVKCFLNRLHRYICRNAQRHKKSIFPLFFITFFNSRISSPAFLFVDIRPHKSVNITYLLKNANSGKIKRLSIPFRSIYYPRFIFGIRASATNTKFSRWFMKSSSSVHNLSFVENVTSLSQSPLFLLKVMDVSIFICYRSSDVSGKNCSCFFSDEDNMVIETV